MVNLNDLHLFVEVIDKGGFSAAARHLGRPKSTISKRVAELEASLGARLVHRTSRSLALTDVGRDFFDHARAALIEAENAESMVRSRLAEPSGTVRLTASVPTAQFHLADHLPELIRAYPKLRLEIHVTDRFVDLVQEGFDIAIRSHFAPLPDSALMQRRMGVEPVVVVAAPAYLDDRGAPLHPEDIEEHDGLLVNTSSTVWRLRNEDRGEVQAAPIPRMIADESLVLLKAATAGFGLVCLPESICRACVESGELVRVLPEWNAGEVTTTILTPHRRGQLPSVRAVIEFLTENR
jgi:DNA-binding transcriptional LysR family regulator